MATMKITWINHSCFQVECDKKLVYFDPYQIPTSFKNQPATVIFASHDHHDHFDDDSTKIILASTTEIVCPSSCTKKIELYKAKGVKPGEKGTAGGFEFEATPAYNPNKQFHPKQKGLCGYIVNFHGTRVFHAGDTDDIVEFINLAGRVDIALLPVGGNFTMDFQEAISVVGKIKPKIVVPMHNWDKDLDLFKKQCEKKNPNTKVALLKDSPLEI